MTKRDKVLKVIYNAVDEVNEIRPVGDWVEKAEEAILFGRGAKLDSLGLVRLVVAAEQGIEEEFGVAVTLADQRAMSQQHSPFRTIGSLADYAVTLLP